MRGGCVWDCGVSGFSFLMRCELPGLLGWSPRGMGYYRHGLRGSVVLAGDGAKASKSFDTDCTDYAVDFTERVSLRLLMQPRL